MPRLIQAPAPRAWATALRGKPVYGGRVRARTCTLHVHDGDGKVLYVAIDVRSDPAVASVLTCADLALATRVIT